MAYNMSGLDNGTTIVDFADTINNALGGLFPLFFLFIFWLILLLGFQRYDKAVGLTAASTITSILSWLFVSIGWIDIKYIFIPLAMVVVGIMWKIFTDK